MVEPSSAPAPRMKRMSTSADLIRRVRRGSSTESLPTLDTETYLPKDTVRESLCSAKRAQQRSHSLLARAQAAVAAAAAQLRSKESFFKSLPRACFAFLAAVVFDQLMMFGYAALLLTTGINKSAYYFAACILLFAFALIYFSLSAVRSENTVELLTAIAVGTSVTATIYYVRLGGDISNVQRADSNLSGKAELVPNWIITTVACSVQGLVQISLMVFGRAVKRGLLSSGRSGAPLAGLRRGPQPPLGRGAHRQQGSMGRPGDAQGDALAAPLAPRLSDGARRSLAT